LLGLPSVQLRRETSGRVGSRGTMNIQQVSRHKALALSSIGIIPARDLTRL